MQLPFGNYPVGNSLYPLALNMFIPTIIFFFIGASYRIFRYFAVYKKSFNPYTRSIMREISSTKKVKKLFDTFVNSSKVGMKRKPITTAIGVLMHLSLIVIIFLLAQHMVFWAYYIPPYKILFPLAIPESSADGVLAFTHAISPYAPMPNPFVHNIWGPLTIILNGQYMTYLLIILLGIKLGHKFHALAEGLTLRSGDWWFFLLLYIDVILGFLAASHIPSSEVYDNILGAHILVAEILIATLPFTRGFHMFEFYFGKVMEWYFMTYKRGEK